jgi:hypothetical protein
MRRRRMKRGRRERRGENIMECFRGRLVVLMHKNFNTITIYKSLKNKI